MLPSRSRSLERQARNARDQDVAARFLFPSAKTRASRQLGEESCGVLQVGGIEALGKPAVDGREQLACFRAPTLLAPQPGEARRRAQFERFRLLLAGDAKSVMECGPGVLRSAARQQAQAFETMEFGFPPALADRRGGRQRFHYRCERRAVIAASRERLRQQPETVGAPQPVGTGFLPLSKALADLYDSVSSFIVRRQDSAPQDARVEEQDETLLRRQGLGGGKAPLGALRLAPELVNDRCKDQRQQQTEWVAQLLGQMQRIIDAGLRLIWIAEHPPGPPGDKAGANSRIVRAIDQRMRSMPFRFVEVPAGLAMGMAQCRLAPEQTRRPGGMMGL